MKYFITIIMTVLFAMSVNANPKDSAINLLDFNIYQSMDEFTQTCKNWKRDAATPERGQDTTAPYDYWILCKKDYDSDGYALPSNQKHLVQALFDAETKQMVEIMWTPDALFPAMAPNGNFQSPEEVINKLNLNASIYGAPFSKECDLCSNDGKFFDTAYGDMRVYKNTSNDNPVMFLGRSNFNALIIREWGTYYGKR